MMTKDVFYLLVAKDATNHEKVRFSPDRRVAHFSEPSSGEIKISYVKENNRGWTFETWLMGSSRVLFFFSRGNYVKILDQD